MRRVDYEEKKEEGGDGGEKKRGKVSRLLQLRMREARRMCNKETSNHLA